ncbi:hypothetical protein HDU87_008504 [Geranomyces variabilis]|uniref:Centrosomal protein of 70 kDa n=1 Tax=Geranomyces variabilis TaxID=109894 RepID=A0AAD5TNP5_9FUNG|nr:hypothetical protein HDU87_008504 [Geranomyces variabilis]
MASRRPSSAHRPDQEHSTPSSSHHSIPNSVSAGDRTGTTGVDENEEFVRYIMQGSGVENDVDFAVLRRELDTSSSTSPYASKLQSYHNSTTTADSSPSVHAERGRTRKRDGEAQRPGYNRKASDVQTAAAERNPPLQRQEPPAHLAQAPELPPPPAALQRVKSTEPNPSETDTQPILQRARAPSYSQNRALDGPRSAPAAPAHPDDEYAPEFIVDPPRSRGTSDYGGRAPLASIENVVSTFGTAQGKGNSGTHSRDERVNPAERSQDAKAYRKASSAQSDYSAHGNHGHVETQESHVDEPSAREPANDRHRPPTLSRASSARSNYSQQREGNDVARNDGHRRKSFNPAAHMQAHVERHDEARGFWRASGSQSANTDSPGSLQYEESRPGYSVGAQQHQQESQPSNMSAKLQETSSQLFSAGFPRLHPSLMHTRPTPANPDAEVLTERQADALRATVGYLLSELNRKNDLVQDLHTRAAAAEEERSKVLERTQRMYTHRQREAGADINVIEQLQHSLRSSNSETKIIESDLVAAQATVADLRARCAQLEKQRKIDGEQTEKLRMMLADTAEKAEKTRQRNERTFAQITGQYERNPNKSGLDRLTLEVINVYEETLAKTRAELAELRKQNAKTRGGQAGLPPNNTRHSSQQASRPGSAHRDSPRNGASPVDPMAEQRAREPNGNSYGGALESAQDEESQSALARAMGQQVNSLTARLAATSAALAESQKENDLLNLRLLATKKTEWTRGRGEPPPVGERGHGSGLQTRDLIRMDKQAYRLRLYKIDGLDVAACRELLKDVCVKFECNDVTALPAVLERVEICLRLVPQMDQFIQDVAAIVKDVSTRIVGDGGNPVPKAEIYHRLPHLKSAIQDWAKKMPDVEVLKDFRTRVHRALSLPQTPRSSDAVFEEIARLQTRGKLNQWSSPPHMTAAQSESAAATLAVNRFRDLFQLRADDDVLARMNQLFVFCDDANSGIAKLRTALDMDVSAPPARVLLRAVDAVRSLGELSDAMRRSVRRTSIDRLQEAQDRRKSPDAFSRAEYRAPSHQTQQHQPPGRSPDPFVTADAPQNQYQEPEYQNGDYHNDAHPTNVETLPSPSPIISALPTLQEAWRNRAFASQIPHGGRSGAGGPSTTTTATEYHDPQPFPQYGGGNAQRLQEEEDEDVDEYGLKPIDQRGGNLDQTQQFRAREQGGGRPNANARSDDNSVFNTPGAFARGAASPPPPPPAPDFGIERLTEERRPPAAASSSAASLAPPPASPPQISPTARRMRDAVEYGYTGLDMLLGATKTHAASTGELLLGDDGDTSGLAASMEDENDDDLGRRAISSRPQQNQPPGELLDADRGDKIFGSANDATMLLEQTGMEGGDLSFGEFDEGDESLGVGGGPDRGFSPSF